MLFTYDKQKNKVVSYKKTTLKDHAILERNDLEKWIEENSGILGEDLLVITTEYDKFDKTKERLDLLAIDKEGNLVVIELKRDDSGKKADLQAIKYAAYCSTLTLDNIVDLYQIYCQKRGIKIGAAVIDKNEAQKEILAFVEDENFSQLNDKPRIILVSKEFRPEVTASVLWLRKFGLDITCVKITPYILNDSTIVFESGILIPLPEAKDFIIQVEKKENLENTPSVKKLEYIKFWTDLIVKMEKILPISYHTPNSIYFYQISIGVKGIHLEWLYRSYPKTSLGVELHFELDTKERNLNAIKKCESYVPILEHETGEKVHIQENWGKKSSRIYVEKDADITREELLSWASEKMKIFYEVLKPEFDKIDL